MIIELTPEQIARFPEFVEKWTKIGLATGQCDRTAAEMAIKKVYRDAGLNLPKRIVWCGSPLSNAITRCICDKSLDIAGNSVRNGITKSTWNSVWDRESISYIRAELGVSVLESVKDIVRDSVKAHVRNSVRDSVTDWVFKSVSDCISARVKTIVWESVKASLSDCVKTHVLASVVESIYGQHDADWLSFYDYFRSVCHLVAETEKLSGLFALAQHAHWCIPCADMCFMSERPVELHLNREGRLHMDGGMALRYPDGWGVYALNGVRVKPEYALTPAGNLNPTSILAERNADVRRELLRKIGMHRMLAQGKMIDEQGEYKLLNMDAVITPGRYAPYLLMPNHSVKDAWHLEGVSGQCTTVEQALNYRKPAAMKAIPVSEEIGQDWFQQGDVCIWPKKAIALKRYPIRLT